MESRTNDRGSLSAILFFTGLPIFFYAAGGFPRRTFLKESISFITLFGLFLILAQFFLTRSGNFLLPRSKRGRVVTLHKTIGYLFSCLFLAHPFLLVVPRYFEAGVEPVDSLITILHTYSSPGVMFGMLAWLLLLLLLATALFRARIQVGGKTWLAVHRWLSIAFIFFACWHAMDLGRHTNQVLSAYIFFSASCGILLIVKDYLLPNHKQ